jgi:hypothetical protein
VVQCCYSSHNYLRRLECLLHVVFFARAWAGAAFTGAQKLR